MKVTVTSTVYMNPKEFAKYIARLQTVLTPTQVNQLLDTNRAEMVSERDGYKATTVYQLEDA